MAPELEDISNCSSKLPIFQTQSKTKNSRRLFIQELYCLYKTLQTPTLISFDCFYKGKPAITDASSHVHTVVILCEVSIDKSNAITLLFNLGVGVLLPPTQ